MIFRIDLKVFIFLILFYLTKQIEIYSLIMLFAFIHEIGHLLAGVLLRMKPKKFEFMPFGFSISFNLDINDFNKKLGKGNYLALKRMLVAIAGPLVNVLISIIALNISIDNSLKQLIIYSNVLIAIFNLLPIYPLDGGRILKEILYIKFGEPSSKKTINDVSIIFCIVLTAVASIGVYYFKNISIFLIILYLWAIVIAEKNRELS